MESEMTNKTSLWALGVPPLVWSLHFLFSYVFAAVWCAKFAGRGGDLNEARVAIGVATIISFVLVGREAWKGYDTHSRYGRSKKIEDDTPEDRESFLGFSRLLISVLSFIGISYTAYVAFYFRSCI
ncbi:MAG: hypothetical protein ACLGHN_02135 [Bacteriovoracia bacterium]